MHRYSKHCLSKRMGELCKTFLLKLESAPCI